uniref:Uncharacterized protein n=1 Tax=Opuntia streptacantha TaxID=393608 RepID=A0A7C8ZL33_OPUST
MKSGARGSLKDSDFATKAVTEMLPSFENFTALPTIFKRTCISRFSSPTANSGTSGAKFNVISNFLTDAMGLIKLRTSLNIICRLNCASSSLRLPSSSRDRSNTSFIKVAKRLLLFRIVSTINRCSGVNSVSCNSEERAMTACIGVLISWFITAKKSFLARIAVSASLLAKSRATFCSINCCCALIDSSKIAACDRATAT